MTNTFDFVRPGVPEFQETTEPTTGAVIGASIRQEGSIAAAWEYLGRAFTPPKPDPNFRLGAWVAENPGAEMFRDRFLGVESKLEADQVLGRIREEQRDRAVREAAGTFGFFSDLVFGTATSISTYVPLGFLGKFGTVAKTLGGVRPAFVKGAVAGVALDEAWLQAEQETRSAGETGMNVLGAALLGAGLGSAARYMTAQQMRKAALAIEDDSLTVLAETYGAGSGGGGIGAAIRGRRDFNWKEDPGQLTGVLTDEEYATASVGERIVSDSIRMAARGSAVASGLVSSSPVLRGIVATLGDAGLTFRKQGFDPRTPLSFPEAVRPGGTLEARLNTERGRSIIAMKSALEDSYLEYIFENKPMPSMDVAKRLALFGAEFNAPDGRVKYSDYTTQVFMELQRPSPDNIPAAKTAAERIRKEVFDPLKERLIAADMLDEQLVLKDAEGELNYAPHIFDKTKIITRYDEFVQDFAQNIARNLEEAYQKRKAKWEASKQNYEDDITALSSDDETSKAMMAELRELREPFLESEAADIRTEIVALKREIVKLKAVQEEGTNPASLTMAGDGIKQMEGRIKELEELLETSEVYDPESDIFLPAEEAFKLDNKRRRLSQNYSRSYGRLQDRQRVAFERLDKLEENRIGLLRSIERTYKKFFDDMDGLSDEAVAARVEKLSARMRSQIDLYDKTEARLGRLVKDFPELVDMPPEFQARVQRFKEAVFDVEQFPRGPNGEKILKIDGEMSQKAALDAIDAVLDEGEVKIPGKGADEGIFTFEPLSPSMRRSLQDWRDKIASLKYSDIEGFQRAEAKFDRDVAQNMKRAGTIDKLERTLADLTKGTPAQMRAARQKVMDELVTERQAQAARNVERQTAAEKRAQALDPQAAEDRIQGIAARIREGDGKLSAFAEKFRRGASGDFSEFAAYQAEELAQKILGDPTRVVGMDMYAERGPELARALNIPLETKMKYLETDAEKATRIYLRSVLPDLELKEATGSVNGAPFYEELRKEYRQKLKAVDDLTELPKGKKGDLETFKQKRRLEIRQELEDAESLVLGLVERLRGQRAIPRDPDSFLYRAGRMVQNHNILTMMGNVVVSSLVEPAGAVYNYGFDRVWRNAVKPMMSSFKDIRLSQLEARRAGLNEMLTQERMYALADTFNEIGRRTKFEKFSDFMVNQMGYINLSHYYTQATREWVTPIAVGRFMDALIDGYARPMLKAQIADAKAAGNGELAASLQDRLKGYGKQYLTQREGLEILAQLQMDETLASRILTQADNGGMVRLESEGDNLWVPHTEKWQDVEARRAFHTMLNQEITRTILQPGLERPLFTDASLVHKLAFQFQSFMWSAHTKFLIAGLQRRDADVLEGIAASIPLAMFSYWADSVVKGRAEELENEDWRVWADEAIRRSSFTGALGIALPILERIPATQPFVNFSEQGTTRRFAGSTMSSLLGPWLSTGQNAMQVMMELDEPTQSTADKLRRLAWLNNVTYLRGLYETVENAASSGLPERRE